ncbi:MAG: DinB family protein [Actinomycetota bacterium]
MPDWVIDFYRQNEWANLTLIEACGALNDAQLDASAVGTFGSIRDTLRHIVSAEGGYAYRLGSEPSRRLQRDDPWPGLDALKEMASAAADALVSATRSTPDRIIRVGSDDEGRYDVEAAVILIQAFHHSTEHRSQICTILTTLGIEPPELSGWDWGLAAARMRRA